MLSLMVSIVPSSSSVCERMTHFWPCRFAVSFLSFHFFATHSRLCSMIAPGGPSRRMRPLSE
jgi:hypothetical protein